MMQVTEGTTTFPDTMPFVPGTAPYIPEPQICNCPHCPHCRRQQRRRWDNYRDWDWGAQKPYIRDDITVVYY